MFSFLNKKAQQQTADDIAIDLHKQNQAYRVGEPNIPDAEYDERIETLRQLDPNHSYLHTVEAETLSNNTVKHTIPMLSTQKCYHSKDVNKWLNSIRKVADELSIMNPIIRATVKLDGVACKYTPEPQLSTRGDGFVGNNITSLLKAGLTIVGDDSIAGVGEIIMRQDYFDTELKTVFSHPRNVVAGIVNSDVLSETSKKALNDNAVHLVLFKDMPSIELPIDEFESQQEDIEQRLRQNTPYPYDGVVYEVQSTDIRKKMGATSHHNNWQTAKKTKAEEVQSTVIDVKWGVGRSGVLSPVVIIEPVRLSGALTSKVTGHHAGNIIRNKIGKGATVALYRAGEVIPYLNKVLSPSETVNIPTKCPSCGGDVRMVEDQLYCAQPDHCSEKKASSIIHHFSVIEALLFGRKTVEKLVSNGFDSIENVYQMTIEDIKQCGLGEGQAKNLLTEIHKVKTQPLNDYKLVASLGISNLGRGSAKKLLSQYNISEITSLSSSHLMSIDGFGDLTSVSVSEKLKNNSTLLFLLDQKFNLIHTQNEIIDDSKTNSNVKGKNIVITGKCSLSRSDMESWAAKLGCYIQSSPNNKTDFLVCGENVGQSKMNKAKEKGITIVTEQEFRMLVE